MPDVILPEQWTRSAGINVVLRTDALAAAAAAPAGCNSLPPNVQSALLVQKSVVAFDFTGDEVVIFGALLGKSGEVPLLFAVQQPSSGSGADSTVGLAERDPPTTQEANLCDAPLLRIGAADLATVAAVNGTRRFVLGVPDGDGVLVFNATATTAGEITTNVPAPSEQAPDGLPIVVVVAIVVTVITTVALLATLFWFVCRRRSPSSRTGMREAGDRESIVGLARTTSDPEMQGHDLNAPSASSSMASLDPASRVPRNNDPSPMDPPRPGVDEAEVGAAVRHAAEGAGLSVDAVLVSLRRVQPARGVEFHPPEYDDRVKARTHSRAASIVI